MRLMETELSYDFIDGADSFSLSMGPDVTPRNRTIIQPGVEQSRVMKGRGQKWDHTASDISITKMINEMGMGPDEAKRAYGLFKMDGLIDPNMATSLIKV